MAEQAALARPTRDAKPLRCAWLGPVNGGLAWLFQRLANPVPYPAPLTVDRYPQSDTPQSDLAELQRLSQHGGLDRIILACSTRLEYPWREIEFLQRDCPDIPLAVACDSWWDGARRTGLGSIDALTLPWHRWWDGWTSWLEGRQPDLFGPCQPSVAPWAQAAYWSSPSVHQPSDSPSSADARNFPALPGIIVSNCRQTCQALTWVGQACGFDITAYSWQNFQQQVATHELDGATQWILWDDSCLNTSGPQAAYDPALENFFQTTSQALPSACLIAALSLPRADQWIRASAGKSTELIVKPDSGQALTRLLMHLRSTAAAPQPH